MKNMSGNALFLILIAVALFAALSYAITQSGRGGGGIDREQAELLAAQMLQISTNTSQGLQRFMLTHGYAIEEIDFHIEDKSRSNPNANCTSDACNLFHPDGGGITVPDMPSNIFDLSLPYSCAAGYYIMVASIEGVGTDLPEILFTYCGIRTEICRAINRGTGIQGADSSPVDNMHGFTAENHYAQFSGNMSNIPVTTPGRFGGSDGDPRLVGAHSFCSETGNPTQGNFFYHVLLPR